MSSIARRGAQALARTLGQTRTNATAAGAALSNDALDLSAVDAVRSMVPEAEPEEVVKRLHAYRAFEGPAFTVIKVGGDVVEHEMRELTDTVSLLAKVGLKPVVIHGGGPQMNDELAARGVEPQYIQGSRVTDKATLDVATRVFSELNERVVAALADSGVSAQGYASGVFNAEVRRPELKFVGEVTGVNDKSLKETLGAGRVPVLTSLGQNSEGQLLNVNADVAARDLVLSLQPMRVLFASSKGGWLDDDTNEIVEEICIDRDYEDLASRDYEGRQGTLLKLNEIKLILDNAPPSTAVAITAADAMLRQLFVGKNAGTIFRAKAQ